VNNLKFFEKNEKKSVRLTGFQPETERRAVSFQIKCFTSVTTNSVIEQFCMIIN
jgi:hypothetical protein